jgi:hypothetical protein
MTTNAAWLLLTAFVASSVYFLIVQKGKRDSVFNRLHISRRRVSGAKTPPRSLSPSKKQVQGLADVNYVDTLPPSRRQALADMNGFPTLDSLEQLPATWTKQMVPLKTSYMEADDDMYMPCGFSIKDIKILGDFPDYATLSGVPLPQPYPEFDINKALPRPYRPFRWSYHQTMCR